MVRAKNYETTGMSTFIEVMQKKTGLFFPDTVYITLCLKKNCASVILWITPWNIVVIFAKQHQPIKEKLTVQRKSSSTN